VALLVPVAAVTTTGAATTHVLPEGLSGADRASEAREVLDLSAADASLDPAAAAAFRDRGASELSRSERRNRRPAVDPRKAQLLRNESTSGGQLSRTEEVGGGDPRAIAQALLPSYGFSADQFSCLDALWTKESGWDVHADNPSSSAYGIPQALPGSKMATAGADWAEDPATQVKWGLGYIRDSYGSPCGAWAHSQSYNWY
jgi:hypothetical protein